MTTTQGNLEAQASDAARNDLGEVFIIDCDAHLTEPSDLWSARTPAALRDRMPIMKTVDGKTGCT